MAIAGAPLRTIVGNLAALMLGCACIIGLHVPKSWTAERIAVVTACIALAGLAGTILIRPEIVGIRRWLPAGPIRLHGGMLLLPALLAVIPYGRHWLALPIAGAAALIFWLQPDFASALALASGLLALATLQRSSLLKLAFTLSLLPMFLLFGGDSEPASVRFVETVIQQSFAHQPVIATGMIGCLLIATIGPVIALQHTGQRALAAAAAVAATLAGYSVASLIGPFPTPLIGYGPAAIIGMAISLALMVASAKTSAYDR